MKYLSGNVFYVNSHRADEGWRNDRQISGNPYCCILIVSPLSTHFSRTDRDLRPNRSTFSDPGYAGWVPGRVIFTSGRNVKGPSGL